MAISSEQFAALKAGDRVNITSHKHGRTHAFTGDVLCRTKTGVKIVFASGAAFIFVSPYRYRGESVWDAKRVLVTAEEFGEALAAARDETARAEARKVAGELANLKWSHVSASEASELIAELHKKVERFAK
jgi:hypothetical protein